MKSISGGLTFSIVSILAFLLIYFYTTKKDKSFPINDGWCFLIIFALGLTMSIFSGSRFLAYSSGAVFPRMLLNILKTLGYSSFAICFLTPIFTKIGLKIPLLYGYKQGVYTISTIIIIKWLLVRSYDVYKLIVG